MEGRSYWRENRHPRHRNSSHRAWESGEDMLGEAWLSWGMGQETSGQMVLLRLNSGASRV